MLLESLEQRNLLAAYVWTGAIDSNWGNPANWDLNNGTVPSAAADTALINDVANDPVLDMARTVGGITGNGILDLQNFTLTLNTGATNYNFGGVLTGAGGITKQGTGTLTLSGSAPNTFTGTTTVNTGVVLLSKTAGVNAVGGPINIETTTGSAGIVRLAAADQIPDNVPISINAAISGGTATLDLATFNETVGPLTFRTVTNVGTPQGAAVAGTGTLTLNGDVVFNHARNATGNAATNMSIVTPVNLNGTRTITVNAEFTGANLVGSDASITGAITGGTIVKEGSRGLLLSNAGNNFTAPVQINAGSLIYNVAGALGTGTINVNANGSLISNLGTAATINTAINVASGGNIAARGQTATYSTNTVLPTAGTLRLNVDEVTTVTPIFTSPVALTGDLMVQVGATSGALATGTPQLNGVISGGFGLTKTGIGTLQIGGTNTYTGDTRISAGLIFAMGNIAPSANGNLGNSANPIIIETVSDIRAGLFSNGGAGSTISRGIDIRDGSTGPNVIGISSNQALTINGPLTFGDDITFQVNQNTLTLTSLLQDSGGTRSLTKTGGGTLTMNNVNNSYTGSTTILAGTVNLNGNAPSGGNSVLGNATSEILLGNTSGTDSAALLTNGAFTLSRPINVRSGSTGAKIIGGNASAVSTINSLITLNDNVTLRQNGTGTVTIDSLLADTGGTRNITKDGSGTVVLANATNSFTGTTTVNAGVLRITQTTALGGNGPGQGTVVNNLASLELSGNLGSVSEPISARGIGFNGTGALRSVNGNNTLTAASFAGATAISNATAGTTLTIEGDHNLLVSPLTASGDGNIAFPGNLSGELVTNLTTTIDFSAGFAPDAAGLTVIGATAGVVGTNLRLHNNTANQLGAAWSTTKQSVAGGFVSEFTYDFSSPGGGGADGLGFSIHNRPEGSSLNTFVSTGAEHGPANSNLTITLDSWNGGAGNSRLEVWQNGALTHNLLPGFDLSGTSRNVRVEYVPGTLTISFDLNNNGVFDDIERVFTVGVDLGAIGAVDESGNAWVGFSGRSGGSFENRDLTRWTFATGASALPQFDMLAVANTGSGATTASGNNTYDGETVVNSGTLVAASPNALGSTTGGTTVNAAGRLGFSGGLTFSAEPVTSVGGELANISGNNLFPGNVLVGENRTFARLDFGRGSQRVEPGFTGISLGTTTDLSGDYSAPQVSLTGVNYSVAVAAVDQSGTSQGTIDWRDRGDGPAGSLVRVGEDLLKNNNSVIRITLTDIPAGTYTGTSYHIDSAATSRTSHINVWVDSGTGFNRVTPPGVPGNSNITTALGSFTTATVEQTKATFSFTSDGVNPVIIVFDGRGAANAQTEMALNGLVIQSTELSPSNVTLSAAANTSLVLSGIISDGSTTSTVTKTGQGTVELQGANTYDGATTIGKGVLVAANDNALGDIAHGTTVLATGTLAFSGNVNVAAETVTVIGNGTIQSLSGVNSFAGNIELEAIASFAAFDFGLGNQRVEPGFLNVGIGTTANITGNYPATIFTADTGVQFTLAVDAIDQSGATVGTIDWRDRGDSTSTEPLILTGEDHLKNNSGIIRVALSGIPAGTYNVRSFHSDVGFDQSNQIRVFVNTGTGFVDTGAAGNAGTNVALNSLTTTNVLATSATFSFTADGVNDVILVWDGRSPPNGDNETPLSALVITPTTGSGNLTVNTVVGSALIHTGAITDGPDDFSVTKTGQGVYVINGANTYNGPLNINAGFVFGTGSVAADVNLAANAILSAGAGYQNGAFAGFGLPTLLNVPAGAPLAGTLTTGSLNLAANSISTSDITSTGNDRLIVNGTVTIAPGTAIGTGEIASGVTPPAVVVLLENDGTDPINGTFLDLPDGASFTFDGFPATIYYTYDSVSGTNTGGNDVAIVFTPPLEANDDTGFATNQNSALLVNAVSGVLANDEGDPLTIVHYDRVSAQDASVAVNPDGSFRYFPGASAALRALPVGASVTDTFTYSISNSALGLPNLVTAPGGGSFPVSNNDLLTGLVATVTGTPLDTREGTSGNPAVLTNGQFGSGGIIDGSQNVAIPTGTTLTYSLDLGASPNGYDISRIDTFTGWQDAGRSNQDYTVHYSSVLAPNVFTPLFTVSYAPGQASAQVTLAAPAGTVLAANVAQIRFEFGAQQNGHVGYREIDVTGVPSATLDTATVSIVVNGLNDAPRAVDDLAWSVLEKNGATLLGNVLANDSDPDTGDTIAAAAVNGAPAGAPVTLPSGAIVTLNANGALQYNPNGAFVALTEGQSAIDSFMYTVTDGRAAVPPTVGTPVVSTNSTAGVFAVSNADLLAGRVATVTGTALGGQEGTSNNAALLTNGVFGPAGTPAPNNTWIPYTVSIANNTTLTYSLDLVASPDGFDLTAIETFSSWRDAGRDRQNYTVRYATVDNPNVFIDLVTVGHDPNPPPSGQVTIVPSTGVLATRVGQVQFSFAADQENGYVGYRELDVHGHPSNALAVSTATVNVTIIGEGGPPDLSPPQFANVIVNEGALATNSGTFSDPDPTDSVTFTASIGQITQTGTNSGTWNWSLPTSDGDLGPITVNITATDSTNATSTLTFTYTVLNVPPTLVISGPASIAEGSNYVLGLSATDPGDDTITSWTINWGDGSTPVTVPGGTTSLTHEYDNGPNNFVITATATDEDGTFAANNLPVNVLNAAPQPYEVGISIDGELQFPDDFITIVLGLPVTFVVSTTDPALDHVDGPFSFDIDFGDGNFATGQTTLENEEIEFTHLYTQLNPAGFQPRVRVTDRPQGGAQLTSPWLDLTRVVIGQQAIIGDALYVGGTEGSDRIIVNANGSIRYNSKLLPNIYEGGRFVVLGNGGNDTITTSSVRFPIEFFGGAGNDYLAGGSSDDILDGGDGNDRILGGNGNDILLGGGGSDRLYGGAGNDYGLGDHEIDLEFGEPTLFAFYDAFGEIEFEVELPISESLSPGADTINGDAGDDVLYGGAMNDRLNGGAGNDLLRGGDGNDVLDGGHGDDFLLGEFGADTLYGRNGSDVMIGGLGVDTLNGGNGDDLLFGGDIFDGNTDEDVAQLWMLWRNFQQEEAVDELLAIGEDDELADTLNGERDIDWYILFERDRIRTTAETRAPNRHFEQF